MTLTAPLFAGRLNWSSIEAHDAAMSRLLFQRRATWIVAGFQVEATPAAEHIADPVTFSLVFGAGSARLTVSETLIQQVLGTLEPAAKSATGQAALLLLELAMEPSLIALDAVLPGWTSSSDISAPLENPVILGFRCRKGNEIHDVVLALSADAQTAVAGALNGRHRSKGPWLPVPVPLSFRVGATDLTVSDVRNLREGDVILPAAGNLAQDVVAVVSEHLCWRGKTANGQVTLLTAGQTAARSGLEGWTMQGITKREPTESVVEATLDELPIRVAFEVGRLEIPLGELSAMLPGYVIPLARSAEALIDILANGRRIGQGEIVSVGDSLGIRVLKLTP